MDPYTTAFMHGLIFFVFVILPMILIADYRAQRAERQRLARYEAAHCPLLRPLPPRIDHVAARREAEERFQRELAAIRAAYSCDD